MNKKTALLAIAAHLIAANVAHADSSITFLPMINNGEFKPDVTTLEELKACVKNPSANDACEITSAISDAWTKAGNASPVPFKYRDRKLHTDQAVFIRFGSQDESRSCDIGWHVQLDFWWSECSGPNRGDGGKNTIYTSTVPYAEPAWLFTWAIASGYEAGAITKKENDSFLALDFTGAMTDTARFDNPYTTQIEQ